MDFVWGQHLAALTQTLQKDLYLYLHLLLTGKKR